MTTPEQEARDILERMGIDNAQSFTAGDVVELANIVADAWQWRKLDPLNQARATIEQVKADIAKSMAKTWLAQAEAKLGIFRAKADNFPSSSIERYKCIVDEYMNTPMSIPDIPNIELPDFTPPEIKLTEFPFLQPPTPLFHAVKAHLATLTDEGRVEFITSCPDGYCKLCGSRHLPCYCAPGFDG